MPHNDNIPETIVPPKSLTDLLISFNWLALQGFGGVVAVAQRVLVEQKHWITREQFVEDWAVAQVLPGPNVINLAIMIGDRYFGWRGAVAAIVGLMTLPMVLVLALAMVYGHYADNAAVAGALRGMGAVAAGMIAGTGIKLFASLKGHPLGTIGCALLAAACFVAIALLRVPLIAVLLSLGTLACVLTWVKLGKAGVK